MIYSSIYSIKLHFLLAISALSIVGFCAPLPKDSEATIINYENTNDGKGNYYFRFETSNGIIREERGTLVNEGLQNEYISVEGTYTYINAEGIEESYSYSADENGYNIIVQPSIESSVNPVVLATLLGK